MKSIVTEDDAGQIKLPPTRHSVQLKRPKGTHKLNFEWESIHMLKQLDFFMLHLNAGYHRGIIK